MTHLPPCGRCRRPARFERGAWTRYCSEECERAQQLDDAIAAGTFLRDFGTYFPAVARVLRGANG